MPVRPSKATALLYKRFLDEFAMVSSEVLISPPDTYEGDDDADEGEDRGQRAVNSFWERMMKRFGNEARYQKDPDDWAMLAYDGLMFYAEAVKAARSTQADALMKAVGSIQYAGLRGTMSVRALDGQMNAPAWVGVVGKDPKYAYMVLKDLVRVDADKTMPTEAAIRAGRAAAK